MIFYQHGDQLYPTQALAPKPFVQVDIPIDKAGLMVHLNTLMAARPEPTEPEPPTTKPLQVQPGVCQACARSEEAATIMAEHIDYGTIIELIDRIENPNLLANIRAYVN